MSKGQVINALGGTSVIVEDAYYAVQYGLVIGVAFFSNDTWYFVGSEPMPTQDLKFKMIVNEFLFTQNDLLNKSKG